MSQPKTVVIDDRLPINEGMDKRYTNYGIKKPVSTKKSENGAWWQPILEKGYSKFNLNYSQIVGGSPGIAFRELTGMPVTTFNVHEVSKDEVFAKIKEGDEKDWAMAVGCHKEIDNIVTGHAYSVLGAVQLTGGP